MDHKASGTVRLGNGHESDCPRTLFRNSIKSVATVHKVAVFLVLLSWAYGLPVMYAGFQGDRQNSLLHNEVYQASVYDDCVALAYFRLQDYRMQLPR